MSSLQEQLGARIRLLRKGRGLTQEELAGKADLDFKYYGSVERGERNITLGNIEKIAKALGVEVATLFLFTSSGEEKPERIAQAKIVDALKRCDVPTNERLLRILHEALRLAGRG